ncbi:CopG family transcriptional regulator [Acidihalobacter aeolianus]|uniref:CopG family transcriptional regulator n=1 Tax=Acidihalobacter aeolianus TaxID=2792603 RepID=A0A1D8K8D7_9GAMM|nr:CopG family transcriptional regulator [Acidihalobacter aeolianus]
MYQDPQGECRTAHCIVQAAKLTGTTTHSLILEAIAEKADQVERRADFDAMAEQRYADIVESGETVSWDEMRTYLERRIVGEKPPRPRARKLAR